MGLTVYTECIWGLALYYGFISISSCLRQAWTEHHLTNRNARRMCYLHLPTRGVYGELEKLGTRHRLALRLAKDPRHWSWWCCRMFSFSTLVHPPYNIHWANIIWNRLWTYIWMYGKTLSHSFDFEHGTWSELRLPEADLSAQGHLCGRLHPLKSRRTQMLHCLHQRQGFKEKNPKGGSKYATIFVSHQFVLKLIFQLFWVAENQRFCFTL